MKKLEIMLKDEDYDEWVELRESGKAYFKHITDAELFMDMLHVYNETIDG